MELAPKQAQKQLGRFCFNEAGGGRCIRNLALFGCSLVGMSAVGVALIGVSARAGQGSGAGQSVSWVAVAYSGPGVLEVLGRGGLVYRCIGVLPHSCADRSQGPPGSVYRCIAAIPRRSLPGPPWIGVSVYRCITAVRRRSLPGPPWVGVSVYRCMGRGDRCIGVFQFSCPLLRSHCNVCSGFKQGSPWKPRAAEKMPLHVPSRFQLLSKSLLS